MEIHKVLFAEASSDRLEFSRVTTQNPSPGTYTVLDGPGDVKFQLFFDALDSAYSEGSLCRARIVVISEGRDH